MNRIVLRANLFRENSRILERLVLNIYKWFSSSSDKEKNEPKNPEIKVIRKGILHDKQQSLHEESYFHKEEIQQLKALKKKFTEKQENKDGEKEG